MFGACNAALQPALPSELLRIPLLFGNRVLNIPRSNINNLLGKLVWIARSLHASSMPRAELSCQHY